MISFWQKDRGRAAPPGADDMEKRRSSLWAGYVAAALCFACAVPGRAQTGTTVWQDGFNRTNFNSNGAWVVSPKDWNLQRTYYGNQPVMATEGSTSFVRLPLDTYNPNAPYTGQYAFGTDILTGTKFAMGGGLEMEARVRANLPSGLVGGFFPYGQAGSYPDTFSKNEIDFEWFTWFNPDQIWTNIWNDWNPRYGGNDGFSRQDQQTPMPGVDWHQWNNYKIRWLPDRVEWLVNDVVIRTDSSCLPDDAMNLHLNLWLPGFSSNIPVASDAAHNQRFYLDVDWVTVRSLPLANNGVLGTGTGLSATYYDNIDFTAPKVTRVDPRVYNNWFNSTPDPLIGPDTFSARWTGQVQAQYTEPYTFSVTGDDGVRLWINNQLVIDGWRDQGPTEYNATMNMVAGQKYDIRLEYYENGGGATVMLKWSSPSTPKEPIPSTQLYAPMVTNPVLSPGGGTFYQPQIVTVSDAMPGAVIHYTLNGVDPVETDPIIASGGTLSVSATTTLKVRAFLASDAPSSIVSGVYTIVNDTTAPISTVVTPRAGFSYHSLAQATGTATDGSTGSGVRQVGMRLYRYADKTYWNGSTWTTTSVFLPASGTTSWSLPLPAMADGRYFIQAQATDNRGNSGLSAVAAFWIDNLAPVVTVATPVSGATYAAITAATGTAKDAGAGTSLVQGRLYRYADKNYWNGSAWTTTASVFSANGTVTWTCPFPTLANGRYQFRATARDFYGNTASSSALDFTVSATKPRSLAAAPSSSVTFSTGAADATSVRLSFSGALDAAGAADASHYSITVNGTPVAIASAAFEAASNTVVLRVTGRLGHGASVVAAWMNLGDAKGRTLADGQWQGAVR